MREWDASLRVYLDVAKTAIENAQRLASAAETLLGSGHAGPAASLAIIGQEETGKALLNALIGFAIVPQDAIPEAISRASHHGSKQQLSIVGHVLAQMAPKIRSYVDDLSDDLELSDLRPLLSSLVPVVLDLVRAFLAERPDFDERVAEISVNRRLQDFKHRGLYVDLIDGKVIDPSTVTAAEASAAVADLRASVEGIRLFTQIAGLSDEGVRLTRTLLEPHLALAKGSK